MALDIRPLFKSIAQNPALKLKKLSLSKFRLAKGTILHLSEAVKSLRSLCYLDISGNNFDARDLTIFMDQILKDNRLKWLSLAFNRASKESGNFVNLLNKFIHYSDTLMHIDLSGMGFSPEDCEEILKKGVKKSRTLLSAHLSGNLILNESIDKLVRSDYCTPITAVDQNVYQQIFEVQKKAIDQT